MLNDINKSKMSFESYVKLKEKTIVKSYTERFKWIEKFLYTFSWFGNGISIFLAFFFLQSLFYASFASIGQSMWITIGIIFFLTLFELLKRYIFGMFSIEMIKEKTSIFNKNMISFIIGTLLLIGGSFYFSLNGAKKFVDNQKLFEQQTETTINLKSDSIRNIYDASKEIYISENESLRETNNILRTKLANTPDNYRTIRKDYQININNNISLIDKNQAKIDEYNNKMELDISTLSNKTTSKLTSSLNENEKNKKMFIIISSIIELIIILGVYYDKLYGYKSLLEYEDTVINTTEFKKWEEYDNLLDIIYNSTKEVGDNIPSSNSIIELAKISNNPITITELAKFIKLLYYIDVIRKVGNKRILNLVKEKGKSTLQSYFNIK